MKDDDDLKSVADAMAEWASLLPMNHPGRTLLAAIAAMESGDLAHLALVGPEDPEGAVWLALLTLGTTADGGLKFFLYPAATTGDEIRDRDTLLEAIASRAERATTPEETLASVPEPSTTLAFAYYGVQRDGAKLLGIAWNRDLTLERAVGDLKLVVRCIREREAEVAKGGS